MRYNEEQLMIMPINLLRGLDIRDKEEEDLVQKVWNKRQSGMPVAENFSFPSSVTDNMTVEKEKELQAEIDARKDAIKSGFVVPEEIIEDVEGDKILVDTLENGFTTQYTEEKIEVKNEEEVIEEKKRFCEFCDSKGVRHKKDCTRII